MVDTSVFLKKYLNNLKINYGSDFLSSSNKMKIDDMNYYMFGYPIPNSSKDNTIELIKRCEMEGYSNIYKSFYDYVKESAEWAIHQRDIKIESILK